MALREDFEKTGGWLFRWRSFLPLLVIGIFLLAMQDYDYHGWSDTFDPIWETICFCVSFFGLTIRIFTVGFTPRGTSGRNTREQVADSLNTRGLYSVVRNPLYLGNFFMGLGIALFAGLWWLTLIYVLMFWLYYERIICAEEAFLRERFGQEYLDWAERTPVFLPRLGQYRRAVLSFSFKTVLRREYNGFFAVVLVMFLQEIVGDLHVRGELTVDTYWAVLVGSSFVVWAVLRSLKKYTKLLDVEGR